MTLEQFWSILLKHWRLVLLCLLLVGLGTFIGSKLITPVYQSSVLVQVVIRDSSNRVNADTITTSGQLAQTEATLATSDSVLSQVVPHYPGLTTNQLAGEVSALPKLNTQLFEIDVIDPSPTRAASLANDIAAALIQLQQQQTQQSNALARQQIQQNIDQTTQQIKDTTTQISVLQAKGGDPGQLALLQTQLSGLQERLNQWQTALAQLELTQAQGGNPLQIAQAAQPATGPVRPNVLLNTIAGFLIGLLLGLLLALLYEKLDVRIRTPEAITELLEWPVLGTIWRTKTASHQEMIHPTGRDANIEAYRILRTNIGFASIDKPLHSILITSSLPREGKSTTAAKLAISMAKAGKKTFLIDADLRHPIQHVLFGLSNNKLGLTDAILALSKLVDSNVPSFSAFFSHPNVAQTPEEAMTGVSLEYFAHAVSVPNLWVMPSGPLPPNPAELLESKVTEQILKAIAEAKVDVVIFDSSPLLGLSDASILASKVDGVLVVVDTMRTAKKMLRQMKAVLSKTGGLVIGCVANKAQRKRHDSIYSSYHTDDQSRGDKSMTHRHIAPNAATSKLLVPSSSKRK